MYMRCSFNHRAQDSSKWFEMFLGGVCQLAWSCDFSAVIESMIHTESSLGSVIGSLTISCWKRATCHGRRQWTSAKSARWQVISSRQCLQPTWCSLCTCQSDAAEAKGKVTTNPRITFHVPIWNVDTTDKSDLGNYRPVSLTSVACNIMQSVIKDTLVLSLSGKFSCYQHGFLKSGPCLTNHWRHGLKHWMM